MILSYCINKNDTFYNVRDVLKNYFFISSRLLLTLKKNNLIFLNNETVYLDMKVKTNDIISFCLDFEEDNSNIIANNIKLDIIYEDEALLIINKPYGISVHPSMLNFDNSLSNGVKFYFDKIGLKKKIRIVNRLDKNTSGLVIFAKNEYVQEFLVRQMKSNSFNKYYLGIVEGILNKKSGIIDAPISRKENSIIERCVNLNGAKAITYYNVLKEFNNMSLVEFKLETGRTHQIRVHSSFFGHPIVGDTLYGSKSKYINRQALHSYKIGFIHPVSRKYMELSISLPDDMKNII